MQKQPIAPESVMLSCRKSEHEWTIRQRVSVR